MSHGKKKREEERQRNHLELFAFMRRRRIETQRIEALAEAMEPSRSEPVSDEVGDKMAVIRNRLTHSKRISRERWNRFAGTSESGGRGL